MSRKKINNQQKNFPQLSKRLRSLRKQAKIKSQGKLADLLNIERNRIQRIESGQNEPYAEEILKYADYFNVSERWILRGQEIENPNGNQDIDVLSRQLMEAMLREIAKPIIEELIEPKMKTIIKLVDENRIRPGKIKKGENPGVKSRQTRKKPIKSR